MHFSPKSFAKMQFTIFYLFLVHRQWQLVNFWLSIYTERIDFVHDEENPCFHLLLLIIQVLSNHTNFFFFHRQISIFSFQFGLGKKFNFLIIHGIKNSLCFKIQLSIHFSSQHSMLILSGLKRSSARFNNEKIMSSSHKFLYP